MALKLELGWFIPTVGDTSAFGDPEKTIPPSLQHYSRVAQAAERAGFEYVLIPTAQDCWDAWVTASFLAAETKRLKMLVAIKPGYIHPYAHAKMIGAFDNYSQGRLCLNMIAGLSVGDAKSEGQPESKEIRYEQLEEEVRLVKLLLSQKEVQFSGKYYRVDKPVVAPRAVQQPHPPFFLGGGSEQALDISAQHSATHLFWGDEPERIKVQIGDIRHRAAKYGRENVIKFAMRLQVIVRESEAEAWEAAEKLVAGTAERSEKLKDRIQSFDSIANNRQVELSKKEGKRFGQCLWSGISAVRPGAGTAVVGNPAQVRDQLMAFVEAGCSGFCLSGYPHHEEAERFGKLVTPLLKP
jgi:alkanesulfonate monooxygenase